MSRSVPSADARAALVTADADAGDDAEFNAGSDGDAHSNTGSDVTTP